jgi:transglutaminase-like putative cysteine protease
LRRTLAASLLPAFAITLSWLRIEQPAHVGEALAVVALALAPVLVPRGWPRWLAVAGAAGAVAWIAFAVKSWELLPFRNERVLAPLGEEIGVGIADFYRVVLPFQPGANPGMHGLMLTAIFAFVLAVSLLAATSRPVGAAAVTVVGVGWPATLVDGGSVAVGALALAAALSIPLVMRVRTGRALAAGVAATAVVVLGAAWASAATTIAREAALDWENWDLHGVSARATGVRFAWNSNYDGISFPPTETAVLRVRGPETATYWRASTLDQFTDDHWFENPYVIARLDDEVARIPPDALMPARARDPDTWLQQEVEVRALVDDHLAAAGTPVTIDTRRIGTVFRLANGGLSVLEELEGGHRYRVWSYAPDPAPPVLARSKARYPAGATPYLDIGGREFPPFGRAGREAAVRSLFDDPSYSYFVPYRRLYQVARRVVGKPQSPYEAVLALEAWFRQKGGFRYVEQPPDVGGPPLVSFVTRTKQGYCQHYAGAMAVMLRMLGIPSRVAVGFTSGTFDGEWWTVTDHDAHAWVEVWFRGLGWVPFDPTPGRATFGGNYSFASNSEAVVDALGRGDLSGTTPLERPVPDSADILRGQTGAENRGRSFFAVAVGIGALWVALVGLGKALLRRLRYLTRDPRRASTASRRELEDYLRDQGIALPACATLDDLRRAVYQELGVDATVYAGAAGRGRFGRPGDVESGAENARTEVRAVLRRARDQLSLWARFRGFVSLRSFRRGWQL